MYLDMFLQHIALKYLSVFIRQKAGQPQWSPTTNFDQRRSQEFDLGGYKC